MSHSMVCTDRELNSTYVQFERHYDSQTQENFWMEVGIRLVFKKIMSLPKKGCVKGKRKALFKE